MRNNRFEMHPNSDPEAFERYNSQLAEFFAKKILEIGKGIEFDVGNEHRRQAVEERRDMLEELKALVVLIQDKLYPVLVAELKRFRVHENEEDLKKNLLSREFFNRAVITLASKYPGEYKHTSHLVTLNYAGVADKDGLLKLTELINLVIHEYIHFISEEEATYEVFTANDKVSFDLNTKPNNFSKLGYHSGRGTTFFALNEAVTEKYAQELLPQINRDVNSDLPNFQHLELSPKKYESTAYVEERKVLDFIIDLLSEYAQADRNVVWNGFKQGLLHGDVLGDKDFRAGMVECFGTDIFHNFLNEFKEKNPVYQVAGDGGLTEQAIASLQKRFENNGAKTIKKS